MFYSVALHKSNIVYYTDIYKYFIMLYYIKTVKIELISITFPGLHVDMHRLTVVLK